jgi:hypothetical protein
LPKWCTVSLPWSNDQVAAGFSIVVSDPRFHHRRGGVNCPPCQRLSPFPLKSSKSFILRVRPLTRTLGDTMAPRVQRRSVLLRFVVPPLGASRLRMASPYTWGSFNRATRGHSRPPCQAGSFPNAFTGRRLICLKHWYSQLRLGAVLDRGFGFGFSAARQRRRLVVHYFSGSTTAKEWSKRPLRSAPSSSRREPLSGNASVVGCRASW